MPSGQSRPPRPPVRTQVDTLRRPRRLQHGSRPPGRPSYHPAPPEGEDRDVDLVDLNDLLAASEAALIRQWQRARAEGRDDDARYQAAFLVRANRSLVRRRTAHYQLNRLGREDLLQAGYLGLFQALERFVPDRGRFSAYASFWIRKEVQRALGAGEFSLSVPAHLPGRMVALRSLPVDEAISALGLRAPTVRSLRAVLESPGSPQNRSDSGELPDPGSTVDDEVLGHLMVDAVRGALTSLPDHLQEVVHLVYGLDGSDPLSTRQAARILGVSDFTVRSRLAESLRRLRRTLGSA